mgnify:FL=1|jgi:hypothetical protein|tara:strand:+ start:17 stop:118 length:102 start_codon:yes stop_codon:yes gene_type:complete
MSKRQKVKVRRAVKKVKSFMRELGDGAAYALRN